MRVAQEPLVGRALPACKTNIGVDCYSNGKGCNKCGWDPEVAEKRKQLNRRNPSRILVKA